MDTPLQKPRFDQETQAMLDELLTWDKKDALRWALDVAEHNLFKFESVVPDDPRPRTCLTLGTQWIETGVDFKTIRAAALAAHAAARAIQDPSAIAAARACGHAIATIHVQTHCIGAAIYGLKSCPDDCSKKAERAWQLQHLIDLKETMNHEK